MKHSASVSEADIETRLKTILDDVNTPELALARKTVIETPDRWYGRLVAESSNAITPTVDSETILSAATAVELLRGYGRLRATMFVQLGGDQSSPLKVGSLPPLLAGDFLYTQAYSTLGSVVKPPLDDCFEIVGTVLDELTETFARTFVPGSAETISPSFFAKTAGSLGNGAAVLGATLADSEPVRPDLFAQLGHRFGTVRGIELALESEATRKRLVSTGTSERHLEEYAEGTRAEGQEVLRKLKSHAETSRLRKLLLPEE